MKKKPKELTPQQSLLVKNLLKGKSLTEAALAAGYSEKCPAQAGHQALAQIKSKMPDILSRHGLTEDSLIKKYLLPLMKATEVKYFQKDGLVTDEREVIAWGPRKEGLDMAFKLRGDYQQQPANASVTVGVQFVSRLNDDDEQ